MIIKLTAILKFALLTQVLVSMTGCAYGLIYTKIREPLTTNFSETKRTKISSKGYSDRISEPITGVGLRVEWASNAIGDVALNKKLQSVSYADIETYSVLLGLFSRKTVYVYGQNPNGVSTLQP